MCLQPYSLLDERAVCILFGCSTTRRSSRAPPPTTGTAGHRTRRILGNLQRVVPRERRIELDWEAWERPPVFHWLARHVDEEELRRVFNLGIGWCAVVAEPEPGELAIGGIA